MDSIRKKFSEMSSTTMALCAVGAGVSFVLLRQLWRRVLQKTSQLAYSQVKLLEQINEARTASGAIVYLNIDETVRIRGDNYDMDFNLMTKIEKKEQNKFLESKNPFLPPFETGLHITELGDRHRLLFNKYSIYRNHVLIVTQDFQPQQEKLNESDFRQCILVQGALGGIFYYNSGSESGASQKHKHLQILPSESRSLPFIRVVELWLNEIMQNPEINNQEILKCPSFNFFHGIKTLPEMNDEIALACIYRDTYQQLYKQILKHPKISYNLIGTERFMMLIPRKKERVFQEVSVNSLGFAGSILIKTHQLYTHLHTIKPQAIIADISYANETQLDQAIANISSH